MANLFISYRREDSAPYAGRLCDRLGALFGADSVFIDILDIRPGQDFADAIESTIMQCHVLLAVIGPRWLESMKERRQTGDDFVQGEIVEALRRNLTVIPVLVGGAKMPEASDLPEPLRPLSRHQAVEIRDARFDDDFAQLTGMLRSVPGFDPGTVTPTPSTPSKKWLLWCAGAAAIAIALAGALFSMRSHAPDMNGAWAVQMHKKGQPPYQIRLDLVIGDGTVNGTVDFPTGRGVIQNGTIAGSRLSFQTVHTPQFETSPALSHFRGEISDSTIQLTSVDGNGVGTGIAHRIADSRVR